MTDSVPGSEGSIDREDREAAGREPVPGGRWLGVGAGAAAVLSVLGVLTFSSGTETTDLSGRSLAGPGPVEVPVAPPSRPTVIPSVSKVPAGDFGKLVSLDGLPGGVTPPSPPSVEPEARKDTALKGRSDAAAPKAGAKARPVAPKSRDTGSPGVAAPPAPKVKKPAPAQPVQPQPVQPRPEPAYPAYPSPSGYPYWGYGYGYYGNGYYGGPC